MSTPSNDAPARERSVRDVGRADRLAHATAHGAGRGRRLTALGMSLAIHGTLFAGLSLWSVSTFGGRPEVHAARFELARADEPRPVAVPDSMAAVESIAEPIETDPPELVPYGGIELREPLPDEPLPGAPLEDLAAVQPTRLPLQPIVPVEGGEVAGEPPDVGPPPEAADEFVSAEVEPVEPAGRNEEDQPVLIEAPKPRYPPIAQRRGWQGTVVLRMWVAPDGRVADVAIEASSGFAVFDAAALGAVRRWRFEPGLRGTVEVLHSVRFELFTD